MTAKIHNLAEDGRKLRLAELWQQMKMPAFSHFEDETNFTLIDGIYHLVEARDRQESRILRNRQLALEMLAERGLPVPECLAHYTDENGEIVCLVTQHLPGEPLGQIWSALSETKRQKLASAAGELLARLHASCRFPYFGTLGHLALGQGVPRWFDVLKEDLRELCDTARARELISQTEQHRIEEALLQRQMQFQAIIMGAPIHGAFCLHKILVKEGEISGLIGFSHAQSGDPIHDLARDTEMERRCPGARQAFMRGYLALHAVSDAAMERLDIYRLLHTLDCAVKSCRTDTNQTMISQNLDEMHQMLQRLE